MCKISTHCLIMKRHAQEKTKLDFIFQRLDENNWQCLWCNKIFQVINNTEDLYHLMGKKYAY